MNTTITLTMGDWSHDGHGMTRSVAILSNLSLKELMSAYELGVAKTGVDLEEDVARDYEDSSFPDDAIEKLQTFGFNQEEFLEPSWRDPEVMTVDYDGFWRVWLFIARVGNPDLTFEELPRDTSNINIGGYGMFSS